MKKEKEVNFSTIDKIEEKKETNQKVSVSFLVVSIVSLIMVIIGFFSLVLLCIGLVLASQGIFTSKNHTNEKTRKIINVINIASIILGVIALFINQGFQFF